MVWQTLITSCYKELIDLLTKWLTLYHFKWFIVYIIGEKKPELILFGENY